MAAGWSASFADTVLDSVFSGSAWTPPAASYVQLHTGDPGADGTANVSSYATRTAVTWSAASGGSKGISGTVSITSSWSATSPEIITHVSYWDASTAGTFVVSDELDYSVTAETGAAVSLASLTAPWTPLAA